MAFNRRDNEPNRDSDRSPAVTGSPPKILRASLGADTSVTGKLSFEAPTRIDGKLKGEVRASDLLIIGETGRIDGVVRATRLVVHGQIHGEIYGTESVHIVRGAIVSGTIETHSLTIDDGATVRAEMKIQPPRAATVHVLRRPTVGDGNAS